MNSVYLCPPAPRLFAHRGASAASPENTLPAFRSAVAAGLPYLEMDVWSTADGVVVVHHDETALRLCGDPRRISDLSLAELQNLDAGHTFSPDGGRSHPFRGRGVIVPTLRQVLDAFPKARCNIEIKQAEPAAEELTVATIREAEAEERVLLAAEQDAVMKRIRECCGEIPTSFSRGEVAAFLEWIQGGCLGSYRPEGVALQIPEVFGTTRLVSPETIRAAHRAGLEVHVWTVNEAQDMERLLGWGVDGLMSDHPELLAATAGKIL
ncbi:MAG: glycerophosphodiester phosphodiesterase [Desulfuromonas sp.]|uniref:glycerophosphodiester phosphodiesterase n=1 Tax=Desulfuromonas sp. TaxID=892 RepID=UPI000CAD55EE|nr:glycerophosphodiester phosphodiesterase [Desulfuromonas sp.]PLX85166.1 MAG: glycerophosphodiester phosphodiesterase [Desulfuromonas sp.]